MILYREKDETPLRRHEQGLIFWGLVRGHGHEGRKERTLIRNSVLG
jgi:hypothetical protein